ncbi:TPA: hypothetical protein ACH3X1_013633 [Trebouxia sp. C0004]
MLKCSNHRLTSVYCTITASVLVGGLCTCVFAGNTQASCKGLSVLETCFARLSVSSELLLGSDKDRCIFCGRNFIIQKVDILLQHFSDDRGPLGRRLLQEADAAVPEPGPDPHTEQLTHVHGWLMCLAWGFLIPAGVVIACFRTVRGMGTWWFHLHRALQILGFLVSLAGLSVGVYLDPNEGGLKWQHKIIGITVNVLALVQVLAGILIKPPATNVLRRVWNVSHWTLGRSALALGIANIFIGMFLSSLAYKNIIGQAVVLGGLFIIVMLKNDIEYLLVGCTPAEEEERLRAAGVNSRW